MRESSIAGKVPGLGWIAEGSFKGVTKSKMEGTFQWRLGRGVRDPRGRCGEEFERDEDQSLEKETTRQALALHRM